MTAPVTATRDGGVLVVRLANAAKRNVIDLAFATTLHEIVGGGLADVGAVAVVQDGDHFCVGGDVRGMAAADDGSAFVRALATELHHSMRILADGPPVVVGVRGWAAGAGMSLACAGDVVVAGESAMFQPAYPGIGVTPDGGMSWNLPRAVGARRARSIILRNAALTAAEAQADGIVDEVLADEAVEARVLELARGLADGPRAAYLAAKRLLRESETASYSDQLDAEAAGIAERVASPDGAEGITAFVERRTPQFGGTR